MKKEKRTIAYLIQAHSQEDLLLALVKKLNNPDVCFFIHIDKKTDISKFAKIKEVENVYFVQDRINVVWKGFSQVEATMATIKLAINSEYSFKYYLLLSGVDFPIVSNEKILGFFQNTDKNFLFFVEIEKRNSLSGYFFKREKWFKVGKWHFYDLMGINWNSKNGSAKHWLYRAFIIFNTVFVNSLLKKRKFIDGKKPYFGSSWWNLNEETVKYIVGVFDSQKHINDFYYYTDAPDEMYFQSVVLNSHLKENCVLDNLRYIDWDSDREGPAVLELKDYEKMKMSGKLFARKLDVQRSSALIDRLKGDDCAEK